MSAPLHRLSLLCRRWGGRLSIVSAETFADIKRECDAAPVARLHPVSLAPFTDGHALDWHAETVIASAAQVNVGAVIHEMGHVFASPVDPDHEDASEWDWLGWEVALARQVRCFREWDANNGNYQIEGTQSRQWSEMYQSEKRRLIADRLDMAFALRLVDEETQRPRSIR